MSDKDELIQLKKTFEEFIKSSEELQTSYITLKEKSETLSLYLSNTLENINSAILVFDNNMNLNLWNQKAEIFFSILKTQKPPVSIKDLNYSSRNNKDLRISPENINREIRIKFDDKTLWADYGCADFFNRKKEKMGYIVTITDKTEFKKMEIRSKQEDRLRVMGELAAEVAHEIRNPLGSIELMVSMLEEDIEDKRNREVLGRIRSSVNNMNHTVTNILLYTKNINLKLSTFNLEALIDDSLNLVYDKRVKNFTVLKKTIREAEIQGDYELLKQSIGNVILNAIEASGYKGEVEIDAGLTNNSLEIHISDNGEGIREEVREKIFKPFFTTKNTGTGLGLPMVKRIIEAHNGTVEAAQQDKGTLFIFKIPLE